MADATPIDTASIRQRADRASTWPWSVELDVFDAEQGVCVTVTDGPIDMLIVLETELPASSVGAWERAKESQAWRDGMFIAAARGDVPALCDEVDRLRARVAELEAGAARPAAGG